jgi:proline iminopeptidase
MPLPTPHERLLEVDQSIHVWYQTWGNPEGIPVLFVHGGPGACVADYQNINRHFFESERYYVVEVDQRGTGKSQPSVREDYTHMKHYLTISIAQMSLDFEKVRRHLCISEWLVFGGSWGSTLGLDYCQRYSSVCLGLILRGIFLNTKPEHDAIYARKSFTSEGDGRRLQEFDTFFELAEKYVEEKKTKENANLPLDPNDSQRFIEIYEQMILSGNRDAIWRFYVYENNLMEDDPTALLDPLNVPDIKDEKYSEAMSIAFFEARLFLKGTFETPIDLLKDIQNLLQVPTWVCQGTGDEVCPDKFARLLCQRLEDEHVTHIDRFVDSGHKASSDGMTIALKESVDEYWEKYGMTWIERQQQSTGGKQAKNDVEEEEEEEDDFEDMFGGDLDQLREDAAMDGVGMPPDQ